MKPDLLVYSFVGTVTVVLRELHGLHYVHMCYMDPDAPNFKDCNDTGPTDYRSFTRWTGNGAR